MKFEEFSAASLHKIAGTVLREELYNKYYYIAEDLTNIAKIGKTNLVIKISELNEEIVKWLYGLGFRFESFYSVKDFPSKWHEISYTKLIDMINDNDLSNIKIVW